MYLNPIGNSIGRWDIIKNQEKRSNMSNKIIVSEELIENHAVPELVRTGAFSPAIKAGPFVFISGCAASDTTQDMKGQSEEAFRYMSMVLSEVGYDMSDVVKIMAYITDESEYSGYSEARKEFFPKNPPASSTVVTGLLFPGLKVEVEAVAYKQP